MHSDILNFTEAPVTDEGIEKYEWHKYEPSGGTKLNNTGEIYIHITQQDQYCHPAESYLLFEGRLTKQNGDAYADADVATLTHNGIMHLFGTIQYNIADKTIESVNHPGQATTMLGMLKYPNDFQLAQGLNQLWYKDTTATANLDDNLGFKVRHSYIIAKPEDKGKFSFVVPLKHIFGLCDDYDKVIYGVKHTLKLTRKADLDANYRAHAAAAGKVTLETIAWYMPHVMPSDMQRLELMKTIESKCVVPIAFRARQCETKTVTKTKKFSFELGSMNSPEKPRYILVGFQTKKDGDQEKNPSIFDHCKISKIYVKLNTEVYPAEEYNLSFPNEKFSRAYRDTASFGEKFYGMNELITQSNITPSDFKELYPIFVFDVSKQSEKLKSSVVDVKVEAEFNANVPEGTDAYAVIIYDKVFNLQSNGEKLVPVTK